MILNLTYVNFVWNFDRESWTGMTAAILAWSFPGVFGSGPDMKRSRPGGQACVNSCALF